MWSKALPLQGRQRFTGVKTGSVLRFSYLFLVGRIVTLRSRLCKDYLPGRALKICGAVNKEEAAQMTRQERKRPKPAAKTKANYHTQRCS